MTKEEKKEEINKRKLEVIKLFLENDDYTIKDISDATGISKSCVQRYLTKEEVEKITTPQVALYISSRIKKRKQEAAVLGGINSRKNNVFVKDQNGKFMGSVKNID